MEDKEPLVELEQVQAEVHDSVERAKELVCEARLILRQQQPPAHPPIVLE